MTYLDILGLLHFLRRHPLLEELVLPNGDPDDNLISTPLSLVLPSPITTWCIPSSHRLRYLKGNVDVVDLLARCFVGPENSPPSIEEIYLDTAVCSSHITILDTLRMISRKSVRLSTLTLRYSLTVNTTTFRVHLRAIQRHIHTLEDFSVELAWGSSAKVRSSPFPLPTLLSDLHDMHKGYSKRILKAWKSNREEFAQHLPSLHQVSIFRLTPKGSQDAYIKRYQVIRDGGGKRISFKKEQIVRDTAGGSRCENEFTDLWS